MARTVSAVSAASAGRTSADLTFSYSGTYDAGTNSPECGGGSGFVRTTIESRDITTAGPWTSAGFVDGGTTGAPGRTVTGLTPAHTYEFRASSFQRVSIWNPGDLRCDPTDSGAAGPTAASNQITTDPPVSMPAAVGAFALGGQPASLRVGRKLAAGAGAFVLTGKAAGLGKGRTLSGEPGEFALAGQDATLRADRRLACDAGAFALAGEAVALRFGYSLPCDAGTYALTGQAVRFTHWAKPSPGSADWTAQTNTVTLWSPQ